MAQVHLFFQVNSTLSNGNIIASMPEGFRPYINFPNTPLINVLNGSVGTVAVEKSGGIKASTSFPPGRYALDFAYPID